MHYNYVSIFLNLYIISNKAMCTYSCITDSFLYKCGNLSLGLGTYLGIKIYGKCNQFLVTYS